jgi:multidrug efflux pump subunit AcrA (membrane-fusion protein)
MKPTISISILAAILLTAACGPEPAAAIDLHDDEESGGELTLSDEAERTIGIELETAAYRPMQASMTVPGIVEGTTQGRALITPPVDGRVTQINVQMGQSVKKGDRIAVIESPDLAQAWAAAAQAETAETASAAALAERESELRLSQGRLDAAQQFLAQQRTLAEAGAFSQAPLLKARTELTEAQIFWSIKRIRCVSTLPRLNLRWHRPTLTEKSRFQRADFSISESFSLLNLLSRMLNSKFSVLR